MTPPTRNTGQRTLAAACLLCALLVCAAASASPKPQQTAPWEWTGVSRVVAVGDLHGNHDKLARLLTAAGLVDAELHWSGGDQHLVVAGDFVDRGLDDRQLMDLLRRLETESVTAGGRVHALLGNHEVMNLFWDLRYVNPSSYRQFAAEERKADRRAAAGQFARLEGGDWGSESFRTFNQRFPTGYFGRQASFGPEGEYGGWLMGLPTIVKINGIVYTHGGLTEEVAALGVEGINRRVTDSIARYLTSRQILEREGVVLPVMSYLQVTEAAQNVVEKRRGSRSAELRQAAEDLLAAAKEPILLSQGPLWYRCTALGDERLERDAVTRTLEQLDARSLVVAHSPTSSNRITSRFHDRLFRIDHGIGDSEIALALVSQQGETLVLDPSNHVQSEPMREFPLGQLGVSTSSELPDRELQEFLAKSPVIAARTLGRGSTRPRLLVLQREAETRRGIFKTVESDTGIDRYQHEVAAYRLDRAIGLDMVPVTVLRTVEGQPGSLQAWVDGALDQETAQGYNLEFFESEGKVSQLGQGRIFDALIGNASRKPADILSLVRESKVLLIDHSKAFSTSPDLPADVGQALSIPAPLARGLRSLNRQDLGKQLGELLSDTQIDALLARRDRLLDQLEVAAAASP